MYNEHKNLRIQVNIAFWLFSMIPCSLQGLEGSWLTELREGLDRNCQQLIHSTCSNLLTPWSIEPALHTHFFFDQLIIHPHFYQSHILSLFIFHWLVFNITASNTSSALVEFFTSDIKEISTLFWLMVIDAPHKCIKIHDFDLFVHSLCNWLGFPTNTYLLTLQACGLMTHLYSSRQGYHQERQMRCSHHQWQFDWKSWDCNKTNQQTTIISYLHWQEIKELFSKCEFQLKAGKLEPPPPPLNQKAYGIDDCHDIENASQGKRGTECCQQFIISCRKQGDKYRQRQWWKAGN